MTNGRMSQTIGVDLFTVMYSPDVHVNTVWESLTDQGQYK